MKGKLVLLALLPVFAACTTTPGNRSEVKETLAQIDKATEKNKEVVVKVDDQEVICRREHVVGTRFPQRVCKTRAQIEQERDRSQQTLQRHNDAINMQMARERSGGG